MKTLASKLNKVIAEIGGSVNMTGYNAHQKFAYLTAKDLVEAARNALVKHNVVILSSTESVTKVEDTTTVEMSHTFICGDSGEQFVVKSFGEAKNKQGFGTFIAITGAFKYMLSKNLFVSGLDDDPENDSHSKPVVDSESKIPNKVPQKSFTPEVKKVDSKFPSKSSGGFPSKSSGFNSKSKVESKPESDDDVPF